MIDGKYLRDALTTLILTKVISCLDYCNLIYYELPDDQLNRLQRIQNAAARLTYGKKKRDHITPLLKQLHWLPVKARCHYKIATLVYQFFDGSLAPSLASHLQKYQPSRNLRSSNENLLLAQRYSLKTAGGRAFKAAASRIWNALPANIRQSESLTIFKSQLKTYLFGKSSPTSEHSTLELFDKEPCATRNNKLLFDLRDTRAMKYYYYYSIHDPNLIL